MCAGRYRAPSATIGQMVGNSRGKGQSLAEYALIVTLIVLVALVALTFFGSQIDDILSLIAQQIGG